MEKLLTIEGMHCMHCAGSVKKALEALGAQAQVDLDKKCATVTSEKDIDDQTLIQAVAAKGFEVVGISAK